MEGFQINYELGSTVNVPFSTVDDGGASITMSVDGAIALYKGSSVTQRTSSNGITLIEDFDGVTGCHMVTIDTSDATDAGFYELGKTYSVMLNGSTIDSQTVNHWIGHFALGQLVGADSTALSSASIVSIVNIALIMLGEATITSLDDDEKAARVASNLYTRVRDVVLEDHTWSDARAMATLALLTTTPTWDYANEFQLPTDFLRMVRIDSPEDRWQIHGRKLLTDLGSVNIEYIKRLEDPNDMSTMLKEAISARLAAEMSLPMTGDPKRQEAMWSLYKAKIDLARHTRSAQRNDEVITNDSWGHGRLDDAFRPIASS